MLRFFLFVSIHFQLFCFTTLASSTAPLQLTWSSESFGPDGPWSAIEVTIGSNTQPLNLYPGGSFSSNILSASVCISDGVCYAQAAGSIYDPTASTTFINDDVQFTPSPDFSKGVLGITSMSTTSVISCDTWTIAAYGVDGGKTVQRVDMALWDSLLATLPDGTQYPIEVGTLSMGGGVNAVNQSFTEPSAPSMNYSLITGTLWSTDIIPSNAWAMHIGSVEPAVAPSLILGGYDRSHILSPVSTQVGDPGSINLLDIELNVIQGASPFKANFTSLSGLLANNNETTARAGFLNIDINPLVPYLTLPENACDAIAAQLPVTYQPKYGLYFWNTADPLYKIIVSSASALTFIFNKDESNNQNLTINVPFLLLNLTLTQPIISPDTPYFPCYAQSLGNTYSLGRAFLQAAFIGANWASNVWWLAQAPGPYVAEYSAVMAINQTDTSIFPNEDSWNISWSRNWVVLEDLANGTPTGTLIPSSTGRSYATATTTITSSSSLSIGAKAGIGAGIGAALLAAISGASIYCCRRRSRQLNDGTAIPMMSSGLHGPNEQVNVKEFHEPVLGGSKLLAELDGTERAELP